MSSTRLLALLLVAALGAMTMGTIAADEPAAPAPPAQSIREWMAKPGTAPTTSTVPTAPAQSIREWRTQQPSPALGPCPVATPLANMPATPPASAAKPVIAAGPTSPVTISLTSTLRQGNLVVMLDGVPVFNEKFQKPLLMISQTTRWDPLQVAPGTHRLTAKVYGTKKTYASKTYDLQLSRTKGAALRFVMQGDTLTVELAS